uniref:Uncharacterized protein n=1 Tax=Arundo donax TaxID=35708 RepID=A0A0A9CB32_ARUDO
MLCSSRHCCWFVSWNCTSVLVNSHSSLTVLSSSGHGALFLFMVVIWISICVLFQEFVRKITVSRKNCTE